MVVVVVVAAVVVMLVAEVKRGDGVMGDPSVTGLHNKEKLCPVSRHFDPAMCQLLQSHQHTSAVSKQTQLLRLCPKWLLSLKPDVQVFRCTQGWGEGGGLSLIHI